MKTTHGSGPSSLFLCLAGVKKQSSSPWRALLEGEPRVMKVQTSVVISPGGDSVGATSPRVPGRVNARRAWLRQEKPPEAHELLEAEGRQVGRGQSRVAGETSPLAVRAKSADDCGWVCAARSSPGIEQVKRGRGNEREHGGGRRQNASRLANNNLWRNARV